MGKYYFFFTYNTSIVVIIIYCTTTTVLLIKHIVQAHVNTLWLHLYDYAANWTDFKTFTFNC